MITFMAVIYVDQLKDKNPESISKLLREMADDVDRRYYNQIYRNEAGTEVGNTEMRERGS